MPKYGYVSVEGPHDVELVYRLLSPFGFRRVRFVSDLDSLFHPLVPRTYPPDGDLQKRMPVPLFLQSASHCIAVHSAIGDARLVQTLEENVALIGRNSVTGIGIILDSDKRVSPVTRYSKIRDAMGRAGFPLANTPGEVIDGPPRLGAFVLPDNQNQGTLEDLLLDCAGSAYSSLLNSATAHVDAARTDPGLTKGDRKELDKPAGRAKAIIGAIASVLKPGKAVQVCIQDSRLLKGRCLQLARVNALQSFLADLFQLQ